MSLQSPCYTVAELQEKKTLEAPAVCDIDSWWGEAMQHKLSWVTRDVLAGVKREGYIYM